MASNKDKIITMYAEGNEDSRSSRTRASELEFHYTKKVIDEYVTLESSVIELGCATGYYGMHYADKCAQYTGVDISPDNIAVFQYKIIAARKENVHAVVGDATALHGISDSSFDVVLCLGPMYHLPQEERFLVFDECHRIARPGAVVAFAYINGIGAYVAACVHDKLRSTYPNAGANHSIFTLKTDDIKPGVFFFTSPEEMENDARSKKFEIIKNCGVNFDLASSAIDLMSDEQYECYIEIADKMNESPSCTGLSAHALLICKK